MRYYLNANDKELCFELLIKNDEYYLISNDKESPVELKAQTRVVGDDTFMSLDGIKWSKLRKLSFTDSYISVNETFDLYKGYKPSSLFEEAGGGLVTKIPGKVIQIQCSIGDEVKQGQTLMILEAMKMENEIKANMDGVIDSIYIAEGQSLEAGTLMIEIV